MDLLKYQEDCEAIDVMLRSELLSLITTLREASHEFKVLALKSLTQLHEDVSAHYNIRNESSSFPATNIGGSPDLDDLEAARLSEQKATKHLLDGICFLAMTQYGSRCRRCARHFSNCECAYTCCCPYHIQWRFDEAQDSQYSPDVSQVLMPQPHTSKCDDDVLFEHISRRHADGEAYIHLQALSRPEGHQNATRPEARSYTGTPRLPQNLAVAAERSEPMVNIAEMSPGNSAGIKDAQLLAARLNGKSHDLNRENIASDNAESDATETMSTMQTRKSKPADPAFTTMTPARLGAPSHDALEKLQEKTLLLLAQGTRLPNDKHKQSNTFSLLSIEGDESLLDYGNGASISGPLSGLRGGKENPPGSQNLQLLANALPVLPELFKFTFINSRGNEYFCDIDEEYLTDRFNLTSLNAEVQYYQHALDLVTDMFDLDCDEEMREHIEKSARHLYGLVHARYIVTTRGLQKMCEKFKNGDFGKCPRVACEGQHLLPMGQNDAASISPVKLYCARCEDLYNPKSSRHSQIDGAYFGTSFHSMFFQIYPTLMPPKSQRQYEPRVFGFRLHAAATLARWQAEQREAMKERLHDEGLDTGFEDEELAEEMEGTDDEADEQEGIEDMFEVQRGATSIR